MHWLNYAFLSEKTVNIKDDQSIKRFLDYVLFISLFYAGSKYNLHTIREPLDCFISGQTITCVYLNIIKSTYFMS